MGDYTVKNLMEVANASEQFGIEGMEARFAKRDLELGTFGFSHQKLAPNVRQPFGHRHGTQEEAYIVLAGSGRVKVEDDIVDLRQWDAIRVPGSSARQFEAGPDGLEFIAIGAPQADDTEMLQDWWSAEEG